VVVPCEKRAIKRTRLRASTTVATIFQIMALRDALAAPCGSPAFHSVWTFRELCRAAKAHGRPMMMLNRTPQTMQAIDQAR